MFVLRHFLIPDWHFPLIIKLKSHLKKKKKTSLKSILTNNDFTPTKINTISLLFFMTKSRNYCIHRFMFHVTITTILSSKMGDKGSRQSQMLWFSKKYLTSRLVDSNHQAATAMCFVCTPWSCIFHGSMYI